jgi:hypothetical protein
MVCAMLDWLAGSTVSVNVRVLSHPLAAVSTSVYVPVAVYPAKLSPEQMVCAMLDWLTGSTVR